MASRNSREGMFNVPPDIRYTAEEYYNKVFPFGDSTATNILEFFLGTPDIVTNVFLL